MWNWLLQLAAGLFGLLDKLMGWLHDSRLIRVGRQQAEGEARERSLKAMQKADEIDRRPDVSDPDTLLERLQGRP